jgi:phosphoglycerate dehydrogenase-like enzyme
MSDLLVIGAPSSTAREVVLEVLRARRVEVSFWPEPAAVPVEARQRATGVIIDGPDAPGEFVRGLPRLRAWARITRAVSSYPEEYAVLRERGVNARGGTPGRSTAATAEFALLMMLMLIRRAADAEVALRGDHLGAVEELNHSTRSLGDETVGIVGLGRIGRAVAELLAPHGSQVLHNSRRPREECCADTKGAFGEHVELRELLVRSSVVSLHHRDRGEGGRLGTDEIALMRRDAILVNTAQGRLIDEAALCQALERGHLRGAGLDVFEHEPLPASSPLRSAPRLLLTPHVAGKTRGAARRLWSDACATIVDLDGVPSAEGGLCVGAADA